MSAVANHQLRGISFRLLPDRKLMTILPKDFIAFSEGTRREGAIAFFRFVRYDHPSKSNCFARLAPLTDHIPGLDPAAGQVFSFLSIKGDGWYVSVDMDLFKEKYEGVPSWVPFTFAYTPHFRYEFAKVEQDRPAYKIPNEPSKEAICHGMAG